MSPSLIAPSRKEVYPRPPVGDVPHDIVGGSPAVSVLGKDEIAERAAGTETKEAVGSDAVHDDGEGQHNVVVVDLGFLGPRR
jgi:hypothetical protein